LHWLLCSLRSLATFGLEPDADQPFRLFELTIEFNDAARLAHVLEKSVPASHAAAAQKITPYIRTGEFGYIFLFHQHDE
jgi:hypothetical protein